MLIIWNNFYYVLLYIISSHLWLNLIHTVWISWELWSHVFTERFSNQCDFSHDGFLSWDFLQNILENWEPL